MTANASSSEDNVVRVLKEMLDLDQIDILTYYKGLVAVASRYAKAGEMLASLATVAAVPPEFYLNDQVRLMEEDPNYAIIVTELAEKINKYILQGGELKINMSNAEA